MPYTPSLPIAPFYNSNNETIPRVSQIRVVNPVVNTPKEYYTKILIVGKQTGDPQIIRKLRDIQQDKQKYPVFHFLINQYNKIFEGTPIERACNYSPENQNAIVIKLNTAIEGRTERRLNYLLKDLKQKYGIDNKNIINTNKQAINANYYSWDGEWIGSDGDNPEIVYIVGEKIKTPPFFGENSIPKGLIEFEKDENNFFRKRNGNAPDMFESLLLPIKRVPVSNVVFQKFTSDIYEETGYRKNKIAEPKESFAIANAIINFCKKYNKEIEKLVFNKQYLKGAKAQTLFSIPLNDRNQRQEVKAVILALMNNEDYSNGAQFWDGYDLLLTSDHYRKNVGFIVDENHAKTFTTNNSDVCKKYLKKECQLKSVGSNPKYKSTAAHGRTIFWKEI